MLFCFLRKYGHQDWSSLHNVLEQLKKIHFVKQTRAYVSTFSDYDDRGFFVAKNMKEYRKKDYFHIRSLDGDLDLGLEDTLLQDMSETLERRDDGLVSRRISIDHISGLRRVEADILYNENFQKMSSVTVDHGAIILPEGSFPLEDIFVRARKEDYIYGQDGKVIMKKIFQSNDVDRLDGRFVLNGFNSLIEESYIYQEGTDRIVGQEKIRYGLIPDEQKPEGYRRSFQGGTFEYHYDYDIFDRTLTKKEAHFDAFGRLDTLQLYADHIYDRYGKLLSQTQVVERYGPLDLDGEEQAILSYAGEDGEIDKEGTYSLFMENLQKVGAVGTSINIFEWRIGRVFRG